MTEFKGTKGEWFVVGDDEVADGVPCIDVSVGEMGTPEHRRIADVCCTLDDEDDFIITEEDRANARAIAAVPEMIAALGQAAIALEEAANVLHEANIGGTVLHGTAGLMSVAAQSARAALSRALTPEEK